MAGGPGIGIDRAAVSVSTEDGDNSVGEKRAGSDNAAGQPGLDDREDAALSGSIVVTADVADEAAAEKVRDAFGEIDAKGVVKTEDCQM